MHLLLPTPPCFVRQQIGSLLHKIVSITRCLQCKIERKKKNMVIKEIYQNLLLKVI